jgi:hypothetical protein
VTEAVRAGSGEPTRPRPIGRHWASLLLRLGVHAPVAPIIEPDTTSDGTPAIEPASGEVGQWGTWRFTFNVGAHGIDELGGLRVQLPREFHGGIRNSAFRMQATFPREPNYVTASASRLDAVLQTIVELESDVAIDKTGRLSNLTNRAGYYEPVTRVIVRKGRLEPGDMLTITYGDTRGGSAGFRAGVLQFDPAPVIVAVDHDGLGRFRLHEIRPTLELVAGPAAELLATTRSDGVVGEAQPLKLALLDQYANVPRGTAVRVRIGVVEGSATVPATVEIAAAQGWLEVLVTPSEAGILRLRVSDDVSHLSAKSNPVMVHAAPPARRVLWGDIHSHTETSGDGLGSGAAAYAYARNVSALDFYSSTDHASYFDDGNDLADFGRYVALGDAHDAPGEFAVVHGYEVSFGSPYGHHNVYFRDRPTQTGDEYSITLPELWKALRGEQALTIPHHTLKMPEIVDWTATHDPDLRRNFEIFSAHGLSEAFDPTHPLAIEQSLFTNASTTQRRGTSAQRAWEDGLELSTIASSDDHRAHPGMPHQGVAAVFAESITREAVFDALRERRTYATTGVRILLDVSVDDLPMGGHGSAGRPLTVRGDAVGTGVISLVEVLRHAVGQPGFRVIASLRPDEDRVEWTVEDDPGPGAAIYYVRLRQREPVRGVVAMAWSSPIWVDATVS